MCQKIEWTGIIKFMTTILKALFIVLFSLTVCYSQEDALSILENAYKNINDVSGSFTQTSYIKDLTQTRQFKGRFYIKKDKIRWQYSGKFNQVIYLDKEALTVYDKTKKQAIQSEFKAETYGQLPLALVSRMADLAKDFEVNLKSSDTLILIPKSRMGNIKIVEVVVQNSDFPVRSIKVIDGAGNRIKIDFYNVRINEGLSEAFFKFVPQHDDTVLKY